MENLALQDEKGVSAPIIPTKIATQTVLLSGIFFILFFAALKETTEIALPFILAVILKLVLHPIVSRLQRLGLPRVIATVIVIAALFLSIFVISTGISSTAASWADKISDQYPQIEKRLSFISQPIAKTQHLLHRADSLTNDETARKTMVLNSEPKTSDKLVQFTQAFAGGLFTTFLILLFMLMQGDTFLRRFVEILPTFKDKRQAVDIANEIEKDISGYLLTITLINFMVGISAGIVMALCGVDDPLLWGTIVFILNYIPIVGPFAGMGIFFVVGVMTITDPLLAYVPAAAYLIIHLMEGTFITPLMLARRFTINPVLVILSLLFWSWMWGVIGAVISMPILAVIKIICDKITRLSALGHMLEG